ncbi:citrate lyase subunit beta/citryl-CoA lyase [Saccharopolyspora phatthalungensis]|uniref:Citrate lyase subunit beta/citryl-CoA lyase n=2 Tax=Saccharopolyspora phatthalungensis TaxID=664693 RepID=A0A840Q894_9PSEU|nr:citrate lyase subunit beta/citryl-CoA lyase [Saccharopolyspora phatthalungensis]
MPKPTFVRVNSMASGRCKDDVLAVAGAGLDGLRLPKVGHTADVVQVAGLLKEAGSAAAIHLLLESAYALEFAYAFATAAPAVEMLGLGESDLRVDLGCDLDGMTMDAGRIRVISASRAARLASPCQSVFAEVREPDSLRSSCEHGKRLGFLGRMAIHPAQLPIIHEVYRPSPEEIATAREICAAADAQREDTSVVVSAKRKLVAPPILANARRVLELARALDLLEPDLPDSGQPEPELTGSGLTEPDLTEPDLTEPDLTGTAS